MYFSRFKWIFLYAHNFVVKCAGGFPGNAVLGKSTSTGLMMVFYQGMIIIKFVEKMITEQNGDHYYLLIYKKNGIIPIRKVNQ